MRSHLISFVSLVFVLAIAGSAHATLTPYQNTTPSDQCGAIDPNMGCYIGTVTSCPTPKNYDTCVNNCDCQWDKNRTKCGSNLTCQDTAASEHNACLAKCITDYS
jgi:hypothetical protein